MTGKPDLVSPGNITLKGHVWGEGQSMHKKLHGPHAIFLVRILTSTTHPCCPMRLMLCAACPTPSSTSGSWSLSPVWLSTCYPLWMLRSWLHSALQRQPCCSALTLAVWALDSKPLPAWQPYGGNLQPYNNRQATPVRKLQAPLHWATCQHPLQPQEPHWPFPAPPGSLPTHHRAPTHPCQ